MPKAPLTIGETNPKSGALEDQTKMSSGLRFVIPAALGITSVKNDRIVSIQEDDDGNQYAILSNVDETIDSTIACKIIRWGFLEEALQSGGHGAIAPDPNTFVDGDIVKVMSYANARFAVAYDPDNKPVIGIGSARVDNRGRLSSVAADASHIQLVGAVSEGKPGLQLANQLKSGCQYYQLNTPVVP